MKGDLPTEATEECERTPISSVKTVKSLKSVVVVPQTSTINTDKELVSPSTGHVGNNITSDRKTTSGGATSSFSHEFTDTARNKMEENNLNASNISSPTVLKRLDKVNFKVPHTPFTTRNILDIADRLNKEKEDNKSNKKTTSQQMVVESTVSETQQQHDSTKRRYISYIEKSTGETVYVQIPPSPLLFSITLNKYWPKIDENVCNNYPYFINLYKTVRQSALPNYLHIRWPVPSKLRINNWREVLKNYEDTSLVDMLAFGWPVDYASERQPTPTYVNHAKLEDDIVQIDDYIKQELQHKALMGPFVAPPFTPWYQTSPIMTRDKKDSLVKRIVVDLSFPKGRGVNAGIQKGWYQGEQVSFSLPSITDLAKLVVEEGQGCYMWSIDLARAYRQIRTCPLSTPLLGIQHKGKFYVDVCPPFGCRTSSYICARTTSAVVWILKQGGIKTLCYLDDFVGVASSEQQAVKDYQQAMNLLKYLGLEISTHKCVPPTTRLTWLGFEIDSLNMSIEISQQKLDETLEESKRWFSYDKVSRKQIQSLVGKLKHVAKCVPHADRFFARILLQMRLTPNWGKHPFSDELLKDINWFLIFSRLYNGVCLLPTKPKQEWVIESDATLTSGGAWSKTKFFSVQFPQAVTDLSWSINKLEALTVIHALNNLLPNDPHNYVIVLNTDNQATQCVLSTGKGRDSFLTACSRQLWLIAAINSTDIIIKYKPGSTLILADALSRLEQSENFKIKASTLCKQKNLMEIKINFDTNILTCNI